MTQRSFENLVVFDGRRLTAGIRGRLVQVLVLALSHGRLRRDGEVLVAG